MIIIKKSSGSDHVVFEWNLSANSKIQELEKFGLYHTHSSVSINIQCRYRTDIEISSKPFQFEKLYSVSDLVGYGQLSNGFSLDIFLDSDFSKPGHFSIRHHIIFLNYLLRKT